MKKVEAIINLAKLGPVRKALEAAGIEELTISEVKGAGPGPLVSDEYRGSTHALLLPKLRVETLVEDYKATQVVEAISRAARSGRAGDGVVYVSAVDEVVRIDTGERGSLAIREETSVI